MASGSTPTPRTNPPPNTLGQSHLRWTDEMDVALTGMLIDEVRLRGRKPNNGGLKPTSVNSAAEKVTRTTGMSVTVVNVRNRMKVMKKQYHIARAAINSSGLGISWDGVNKYLDVEEGAWDEYCKDKPRDVKNLRRKFFPLYEALFEVFGDDISCGDGVFNSLDPGFNESNTPMSDTPGIDSLEEDDEPAEIGQETQPPFQDIPATLPAQAVNGARKKRRDPLVDAVLQNGTNMGRVADSIDNLASGRGPTNELWRALLKIEGVDMDLKLKATQVYARDAGLLAWFLSTPDEYKEQALRLLLQTYNLV